MGGVVEEDEVGGLCCVEEELTMYVPKVPYLQESRRGSWEGGWIEDCFSFLFFSFFLSSSFSFHCVCDMEVTSLIYINHKISSLHY